MFVKLNMFDLDSAPSAVKQICKHYNRGDYPIEFGNYFFANLIKAEWITEVNDLGDMLNVRRVMLNVPKICNESKKDKKVIPTTYTYSLFVTNTLDDLLEQLNKGEIK